MKQRIWLFSSIYVSSMFSKVLSCDDSNARKGIGTIRKKLLKVHLLSQISIHFDSGKAPSRSNDRSYEDDLKSGTIIYKPEDERRETGSHTLSRAAQCGRHSPPVAAVGSSSSAHTTFPMLHSQMWLLATTMESEDTESSLSAEAVSYSSRRHLLNTTSIW